MVVNCVACTRMLVLLFVFGWQCVSASKASELQDAVKAGDVGRVQAALSAGADINETDIYQGTPLHMAARINGTAVATLLIERGMKVDVRDSKGRTPLMIAAISGKTEVAELLLRTGADPLAEEPTFYDTPLYVAAMNGHLDFVKMMLSRGVSVNFQNTHTGETPLWVAAMDGQMEVMEFLLSNGADPNIASSNGMTPMSISSDNRVKDLLRKFGAKE